MRVGIGWDVHELVEERELWLGCIHFVEAPLGLIGHSDADVVSHAVVDALLGAASLGDIGDHFPAEEPKYQNYPGAKFLEEVRDMVKKAGFTIGNVDVTIMSDAVRMGERKTLMAEAMASHLGVEPIRVNVKATTWESRGAVGRGEIIACEAIALLQGGK